MAKPKGVTTQFVNLQELNKEIALLKAAFRELCCKGINGLPKYINDLEALEDGLTLGDWYIVKAGNDSIPEGLIKQITE
jgi:hypothetical protein